MDYIVRATAADSQIRAFAVTTKEMVETARSYHNTSPVATAALGRLLSAGAMMGAMMKGDKDLLTLQVKGEGPIGGITVELGGMRTHCVRLDMLKNEAGGALLGEAEQYTVWVKSDVPICACFGRLDVRQVNMAYYSVEGYSF